MVRQGRMPHATDALRQDIAVQGAASSLADAASAHIIARQGVSIVAWSVIGQGQPMKALAKPTYKGLGTWPCSWTGSFAR
mmetsp:Transcript_8282/g.24598  ORF Transcript_8282/g.24598 Transcript_8282/m.24598 type:complete len:80 (+) Transcript_8282:188-427(+)